MYPWFVNMDWTIGQGRILDMEHMDSGSGTWVMERERGFWARLFCSWHDYTSI